MSGNDEKYDSLEKKISKLRGQENPESDSEQNPHSIGWRIATELLAGVIVGFGIGYLLDEVFGTSPLFLIIFLLIGVAASFLNVYRVAITDEGDKNPESKN